MSNYLSFQQVVAFRFNKNGKYASSDPFGNLTINKGNDIQWDHFLLLNPNDLASDARIQYGQEVVIRSFHNKYLVSEPSGNVFANRDNIGDWEKWKFYDFFAHNKIGDIFITGGTNYADSIVFIKSKHGTILLPNSTGIAFTFAINPDNSPMPTNQTAVTIQQKNFHDFYYDKPIPSYDANGENRCQSRGRWDGANCYIAKPPHGTPFIYNNNFYYSTSPPPSVPILGWWDGANAQVGQNNPGDIPFLYNGGYYLKPSNSTSNCISKNSGSGTGNFKVCPYNGLMQIFINPHEPVYNTSGQVIGSNPLSVNDISYYKVSYKRKYTTGWSDIQFSGTNITNVLSLRSGKKYRVKAYYKNKAVGSVESSLGEIEVTIL
jgi:hypothetical protein